ncbi:MAG: ROK family transcriptional regulator [Methyloligellaceae bacterium]
MIANSESLRRQNCALVLSTLRSLGPAAHTDISKISGLSSATVSGITSQLESENILERLPQEAGPGRGRPKVLFKQNPECAYLIAVRITSDSLEYSLVDFSGIIRDRIEVSRTSEKTKVAAFIKEIKATLDKLVSRNGLSGEKILMISITSKGVISSEKPVLLWSAIFGKQPVDFEQLLSADWNAVISLTNETCFIARAIANNNQSLSQVCTLSLGHSIGIGIATRSPTGQLSSTSPAFGHMIHQANGPTCRCGLKGCIEAYSGFYGILRKAFEAPEDTVPANFIPLKEMDKIADLARNGDNMAEYAFRLAGEVLGTGLSRLYSLHGTMPLTITGPGIRYLDLMLPSVKKHIAQNIQVKFGGMPEITIRDDETSLVFEGNILSCLSDLDLRIMELQSGYS